MAAGSASATVGLYPAEADRVQASAAFNGVPSLVALYGRVYDPTSLGALSMIKLGGFGALFVALLAIVLVGRHTRADEETGRAELVGARVVGRLAPLTAALLLVAGTNIVLALVTALGLTAAGLPAAGSAAFGLAWGGVGIAFAAVAAVAVQLASTRRAATGIAADVLGLVYLLRAIGDTAGPSGPRWLTWASPIGWSQQFRPYAGNRWWVPLLTLGFAVAVTVGACALVARRDVGAGLSAVRPGRATATAGLRGPYSLAWRLQWGGLVAWAAAFAVLGLVTGNIASSIGGFLAGGGQRAVRRCRHWRTMSSTSNGRSMTGGPSSRPTRALRIFSFTPVTNSRTACSWVFFATRSSRSSASLRTASDGGRSPVTFSRRIQSRTHQSSSYSRPRSGNGLPVPGRLSNSPCSCASRI